MSEKRKMGPSGFYFQRSRPVEKKERGPDPQEEALESMADRAFVTMKYNALNDFATMLNEDGTPSDVADGMLAQVAADIRLTGFSGAMRDQSPVTARELAGKEQVMRKYAQCLRDYGAGHASTRTWLEHWLEVVHNHATRSVGRDDFKIKIVAPWNIAPGAGRYGSGGTVKKDNLEAD